MIFLDIGFYTSVDTVEDESEAELQLSDEVVDVGLAGGEGIAAAGHADPVGGVARDSLHQIDRFVNAAIVGCGYQLR